MGIILVSVIFADGATIISGFHDNPIGRRRSASFAMQNASASSTVKWRRNTNPSIILGKEAT